MSSLWDFYGLYRESQRPVSETRLGSDLTSKMHRLV